MGAKPDGKTDSTSSLSKAWSTACDSKNPSTIYVPQGRFLLKNLHFKGPCNNEAITFRIDGTLVAPVDYNALGNAGNWLLFERVDGVSIHGGTLDAQGVGLWGCKKSGNNCPSGATTLGISNTKNVEISGLRSVNSQMFHIVINGCQNVKLQGVKVSAYEKSPNTDGIHVQLSTGVTILNSKISTGDDCVSIGPGTTNLWIENVSCGPGHGISIGSLGKDFEELGVQNLTVKTVRFWNTQNGLRIKTWGRPSKGFVKGVHFQHAIMTNVQNPIVIDQNYCPNNKNCPGQVSGVKISDVTYQDIEGTSATEVAVKFDCSKTNPCQGIRLENVNLSYKNKPARATCSNAAGTTSAYNVVNFGARGDGRTDSTQAFLRTWKAACSSATPAAVSVPRGTFLVRSISFNGPCRNRILFQITGTIVAPDNYNSVGNYEFWILFYKVSRLSIVGGTIDAKGSKLWSCRRNKFNNCPFGARSLSFEGCSDVVVSGLTSYNSQRMHIAIHKSINIKIQNLKIIAPSGSPNTDGIHIESSRGITITKSTIKTGDDCISVGPGAMNVWMEQIGCGPGHGISIGSLGSSFNEEGVENVTVANSVFTKTQNGVRIKSWAKPSGGYARNLMFRNLIMKNVGNPIIIDQNYCPDNSCPHQSSGVRVSQVTFKSIKGTSSTQAAMTFRCSSSNPCFGIKLQDIKLTYINTQRRPAVSYCENAGGSTTGGVSPRSCL
ncbi:hypothetical protein RD792_004878 [Penstemon davidsonii]|uniref:Polygalacturonase n=1 Tax=Penstemon davidsonii TaxID=160366 RepID=A0ABR0DIM7_9LAMI|nr:hypothetical protein RD792_004878 [Penstemon davidsonii]